MNIHQLDTVQKLVYQRQNLKRLLDVGSSDDAKRACISVTSVTDIKKSGCVNMVLVDTLFILDAMQAQLEAVEAELMNPGVDLNPMQEQK